MKNIIAIISVAALLAYGVLPTSAATEQTAEEIVAKTIAARGGLEKLKAVQSQRVTGHIISGRGGDSTFIVELKRPGKMRMEMTRGGKTITRIYDGQYGGWVLNPSAGKAGPIPMTVNEIKNIQKEADLDGPLLDYKGSQTQVELIGKEKIKGKLAYKLRVAMKDDDVRYYYFDAASFLILKLEGKRVNDGKETAVESFFHDYRDVNGLKIAFEIVSRTPGTSLQQKIVIDKIELNPDLDDSRFSKPEIEAEAK